MLLKDCVKGFVSHCNENRWIQWPQVWITYCWLFGVRAASPPMKPVIMEAAVTIRHFM